ncbi:hypothetical protein [Telluribacter humicola]|uniref:hypothetical protein n=1 Tax=Telluribacter humicola TaxID=1720261 RepID=UPI001A97B206|nr:hypothetical protein [Telluribacter humicola]
MERVKIGYMTEKGYVEEEVTFEEFSLEEAEYNEDQELNWEKLEDVISANSLFRSAVDIAADAHRETKRLDIASIHSWPEFKTDWKMTCVKVLGKKICTKTPQLFTRMCHRKVYAELSYPSNFTDKVKSDIIDCAVIAASAAVAAAIATGAAGAAPAFEVSFKGCALAKIGDLVKDVRINVNSDASCGGWTPR